MTARLSTAPRAGAPAAAHRVGHGAALLATLLLPGVGCAVELNLATVNCSKYENEILAGTLAGYDTDPIDTVMWLFGYSVAHAGDHHMYGDSLKDFGFALDGECKENPHETLLDALAAVKSKRENPMDLSTLDCKTFAPRHTALGTSDPESANTLTMWLFGYAVGLSGSHLFDATAVKRFDAGLTARCTSHPEESVLDALAAPNPAVHARRPP